MIQQVLFATVAVSAFGILFNVHGKNLIFTGLNGTLGYCIYIAAMHSGYESYFGIFFASAAMSVYAEIVARYRKAPATIFLTAALIPFVPGGGLFHCLLNLIKKEITIAVSIGVNAVLEAGAIAIGIISVSSILKVIQQLRRK